MLGDDSTIFLDFFYFFLRPSRESSHGYDVPVPSLRCSRPTHSSSPFATLRDSTTILRTNSQTLDTEGLERLRHKQPVPGYEIVGSAEGPRGLRKRERRESAFPHYLKAWYWLEMTGPQRMKKDNAKSKDMRVNLGLN